MERTVGARKKAARLGLFAATMLATGSGFAAAQELSDDVRIEEIVVTAQFREQSLSDVPIAITAIDQDFMRFTKLDDIKDVIDFTPGFAGKSKDSFVDTISVRGIVTNDFGVGGDPSIGIFKDGVYQGRTGAAVTSFFDMERAEALRGPQGFLFGRNAISGAISTAVAKPDPTGFSSFLRVGGGTRERAEFEGMANVPLDDRWAMRVAGYFFNEDGFVDNFFAPDDPDLIKATKGAARLSFGYRGDALDLDLIAEYENRDQSGTIYRAIAGDESLDFFGVELRGDGRDADTDLGTDNRDDGDIFSLTLLADYDLGFASLQSISGFRTHEYHYAEDFDGSPLRINNYFQDQTGDYLSQEFRFVSTDDGPFNWFLGASIYKENIDASFAQVGDEEIFCQAFLEQSCTDYLEGDFTENPDGLVETNDVRGRYWGFATYADLSYRLTPELEASAGIRYSYDEKKFAMRINDVESDLGPFFVFGFTTGGQFLQRTENWDALTPRFTLRYTPSDDLSLWASVTRGYKAGGFGTFSLDLPSLESLGFTPDEIAECEAEELGLLCGLDENGVVPEGTTLSVFDPEKSWSYEIGAKTSFLDNRITLDVNGYYYRFKQLQITFFDDELLNTLVENVGKVDGLGLEMSLRVRPDRHWDLLLSGGYSFTDIAKVPEIICVECDGNRLTQNPKYTLAGLLSYHVPIASGELTIASELRYQSSFFGGLDNLEFSKIEGYADVGFRLSYEDDAGWTVAAYVENAFNELYYDGSNDNEFPIPSTFFGPSRPRVAGIDLMWKFGK
ncbi:MAG: TonB-dependent receptor [Rhodothalassiaceae bacterium]